MDATQIDRFLRELGCTKIKSASAWVHATCPLARWTHPGGVDSSPSFGVAIAPGSESFAKCLGGACGYRGSLRNLLHRLKTFRANLPYARLFATVEHENSPSSDTLTRWIERAAGQSSWSKSVDIAGVRVAKSVVGKWTDPEEVKALPESDLDFFMAPPPEVMEYLIGPKRNLTEQTIVAWQLGYHLDQKRISIPVRDVRGGLVGISGRLFDEKRCSRCDVAFMIDEEQHGPKVRFICPKCHRVPPPKFLHSKGFHRDFYLFGEHRIVRKRTGYLVEGHFDAMYLHQCGYNAVALMGGSVSYFQIEKIVQFFSDVVIVPDGDQPGYEIAERARLAIGSRGVPVRIADMVSDKDPDELGPEALSELLGPPNLR